MHNTDLEIQGRQERRLPAWRDIRYALAERLRQWRLRRVYRLLDKIEGESNIVAHVRREVPGCDEDDMQDMMRAHLIRMGQLFATEEHSGFSAAYAVSALEKLLRFEPLGPLTGEPEEWQEVYQEDDGTSVYQNTRCSHVFMSRGKAYDIDARIFREPSGACYTSSKSRVAVTFPYVPKTEYVDVEAHSDG